MTARHGAVSIITLNRPHGHRQIIQLWPARGVHTLRHSFGLALANKGYDLRLIQDYLGHHDPRHTVHYTRTAGRRFEGQWR